MASRSVTELFMAWNRINVHYCSFKSNEHLEEGLNGDTDLDILISKVDYKKVVEIFEQKGYKRFEPNRIGTYPNVINWYGMDNDTGALIHIHLHFELMTGKSLVKDYCLPWRDIFLAEAYIDMKTCVRCADAHNEYVLLCTRLMVKNAFRPNNYKIPDDIIRELNYLKEKISENKLYEAIRKMYGTENLEYLFRSMRDIQILTNDEFLNLYICIKNALQSNHRMDESQALILSYYNRVGRKLRRDLNRKFGLTFPQKKRCTGQGVTVAFVGVDGSGKSTVCKKISAWIGEEFDIKKFYAGSGEGKKDIVAAFLLTAYKRIGQGKNNVFEASDLADRVANEKQSVNLSIKQKIKGIGSSIAYIRILRSNIKHMKEAVDLSKKGVICFMDRYPQNSMPFVHDGAKIKKYDTGKGILHVFSEKEDQYLKSVSNYSFDLVFKLTVDSEVSYARKPDESLERLKYKVETLEKIQFDAKKVIVIDANQPLAQVILEVKKAIWNELLLN